jgi:hypothetical protein
MEQFMRRFTFGPEATDYLRCRLCEDGDALSKALCTIDLLHGGEVNAELPSNVDESKVYKFRTDIFWGWPNQSGSEVEQQLVGVLAKFLRKGEDRFIICEAWPEPPPEPEPAGIHYFLYPSIKREGKKRLCRFLGSRNAGGLGEEDVRYFLTHNNRNPLILTDLSSVPEIAKAWSDKGEVSSENLFTIVKLTVHLIVNVYDGRANLIWSRMSEEELRAKWKSGNIGIA